MAEDLGYAATLAARDRILRRRRSDGLNKAIRLGQDVSDETGVDPDWADSYFGPTHLNLSAERALAKTQHLVDLLGKTPPDHPHYPGRLDRALRAFDRTMEFL